MPNFIDHLYTIHCDSTARAVEALKYEMCQAAEKCINYAEMSLESPSVAEAVINYFTEFEPGFSVRWADGVLRANWEYTNV